MAFVEGIVYLEIVSNNNNAIVHTFLSFTGLGRNLHVIESYHFVNCLPSDPVKSQQNMLCVWNVDVD